MNDETALLAAITAQPDEDTPRLAYADWLDEHEAPIQAEFVRTQCRLAAATAADADYPDLLERSAELAAQFAPFAKHTVPTLPPGFTFDHALDRDADNFRRGFLYAVGGEWNWYGDPADQDAASERIRDGLAPLLATTTARQLRLHNLRSDALAHVLTAPGAAGLSGLSLQPVDWGGPDTATGAIAALKGAPDLERLALYVYMSAEALAELATAKFGRLAHFELPMLYGPATALRPLFAAPWFQRLRTVRAGSATGPIESALLGALAALPNLDHLDLRFQHPDTVAALGSARGFRNLTRLTYWFPHHRAASGPERLAKGTFPRLAELDLWGVRSAHLAPLMGAKWLPQLRVLSLRHGFVSDKAIVALARSRAAANLRALQLDGIEIGKGALAALGDARRFPNLTTLQASTSYARKVTAADVTAFATNLNLPRLRHLNLNGWPLGDDGARALASNPTLGSLTRLLVSGCGIGEKGLGALVRSKRLQGLIELDVSNNTLTTAAALRDAGRLPRLAAARLAGNAIPHPMHRRLHAARGLAV